MLKSSKRVNFPIRSLKYRRRVVFRGDLFQKKSVFSLYVIDYIWRRTVLPVVSAKEFR